MQKLLYDFESFSESWWPYIISLIISVISAIRIYVGGTYCDSQSRIDGKIVVITGGSSGIGLEVAKELAKRGGNLILAIRNAKKGVAAIETIKSVAKNATVIIKLVDISEFGSIRNFVDDIKKDYKKIDILVNNAATISSNFQKTPDGNELTFVTNYLGPFLLTHLLLPLLNNSENGRVINVSAMAHMNAKLYLDGIHADRPFNDKEAFASSKLALTIFTKYMARLYKDTNMTFNSVNPGLVRNTEHLQKYSGFGRSFFAKLSVWPWIWLFLKTPNQGCQSIIYLAIEPALHKVSGYYFSECEIKEPSDLVNDESLAKALYDKSCKIVCIDPEEIASTITNECATEKEE